MMMMMMSTLKTYFHYHTEMMCGIPNIALLGTKENWQKLLNRIDKFKSFGEEPAAWESLLHSILTPLVNAIDSDFHSEFWPKICNYADRGSGSPQLSGWITTFCLWNSKGKWVGPGLPLREPGWWWNGSTSPRHWISMDTLPPAIREVNITLDDIGESFDCVMVAGHVASKTTGASRDTWSWSQLGLWP